MEGRSILGVVWASALAMTCLAARANVTQTGQYALAQGTPQIVSRLSLGKRGDLVVTQFVPRSREPIPICDAKPAAGLSIARSCYELSEGEPVHVVLVRDDFGAFSHVHPRLVPRRCLRCAKGASVSGAFAMHVSLDPQHRYYAYVASNVRGIPEQVFRFILQASAPPGHITTTVKPSAKTVAGPYVVSLDQLQLQAGRTQAFKADITHDPHAPGVAPYHVAWVRAIMINTSTLSFGHVDGASDQGVCCEYALRLPALSKGLYKLWLQFDDGTAIYTAPFTFAAR